MAGFTELGRWMIIALGGRKEGAQTLAACEVFDGFYNSMILLIR